MRDYVSLTTLLGKHAMINNIFEDTHLDEAEGGIMSAGGELSLTNTVLAKSGGRPGTVFYHAALRCNTNVDLYTHKHFCVSTEYVTHKLLPGMKVQRKGQ